MYEKLNKKIEELFEAAPKTRRANELKEELLANLIDKYNDQISQGRSEDEAVSIVVSDIGDVDDLIKGLKEQNVLDYGQIQKERQKTALVLSSAIGIYIMSVVVLILTTAVFNTDGTIGVCIMLTMDAVATWLIIYYSMSRPRYVKTEDTIVEDFKEWKSTSNRKNNILKSVRSIVWTLITAIYLIVSFLFGAWAFSWIIFILGVALERIITLIFQLKES
ncbi:MAG TPA: permease prefix domain 1-containing protein [Clostridiaceae bacterium]